MNKYCIKDGYIENPSSSGLESPEVNEYQPDVYRLALTLAQACSVSRIIDIGCGKGWKLKSLMDLGIKIVGIDTEQTVEWCKSRWSQHLWYAADIERLYPSFFWDTEVRCPDKALLICADVIEHLQKPDLFLSTIRIWLNDCDAHLCLLSTPERDIERGVEHMGPPSNKGHVREWNAAELERYLTESGLNVSFIGLTRTHADLSGPRAYRTIIAILQGGAGK